MSKKDNCCKNKYTSIGGQALIEGIMMRGPEKTMMAVRNPQGGITLEEVEFNSITKRNKFWALPVIRGAVALVESMIHGYKALMRSADLSGMMDLEEDEKKNTDEDVSHQPEQEVADEPAEQKEEKQGILATVISIVAMVFGIGLAVLLFFVLPTQAFNLINRLVNVDITPYRALFEGGIKILIFVGYMFAVSFMKDIKRVFMYHGAEHKTIFCFEKGLELTVENVKKQSRFHPRCGTSFMIVMLIVSVLVSFLLLTFIPGVQWLAQNYGLVWSLIRLLLMPLICGLGYEVIRFCGKHDNILTKIISAPGVWLQHISTKEPDDSMIEIAIASLQAVLPQKEAEVEAE